MARKAASKRGETPSRRKKGADPVQAPSLTLSDVRQVKVLADPLRIRILEQLSTERTTKQVAELLGEKPTKLYHHVLALERVGLIRLARTRQNRGTIEKYYVAVAQQFRADSRIFSAAEASAPESTALDSMIATIFESTADEMRRLLSQKECEQGIEEQGVLSYLEVRTDEKHGRQLQTRLRKLIESLQGPEEPGKKGETRRYRLTIAFYPLEMDE